MKNQENFRKDDKRSEAEYLLIAKIAYTDKFGKILRTSDVIVSRCFTKAEAYRFQRDISTAQWDMIIGWNGINPIVDLKTKKAPKVGAMVNGVEIYENIEDFTIVKKSDYFGLTSATES